MDALMLLERGKLQESLLANSTENMHWLVGQLLTIQMDGGFGGCARARSALFWS